MLGLDNLSKVSSSRFLCDPVGYLWLEITDLCDPYNASIYQLFLHPLRKILVSAFRAVSKSCCRLLGSRKH